jgi:hypothetical protein
VGGDIGISPCCPLNSVSFYHELYHTCTVSYSITTIINTVEYHHVLYCSARTVSWIGCSAHRDKDDREDSTIADLVRTQNVLAMVNLVVLIKSSRSDVSYAAFINFSP